MDARTLRCSGMRRGRVAPRRTQRRRFGRPRARGPAFGSSLASCCCCHAARCLCCCAGGVRVVAAARPRPSWLLTLFSVAFPRATSLVFRHRSTSYEALQLAKGTRPTQMSCMQKKLPQLYLPRSPNCELANSQLGDCISQTCMHVLVGEPADCQPQKRLRVSDELNAESI